MTRARWRELGGSAAIFVAAALVRLTLIGFGLPRIMNADEPYILKDPFKLTFLYRLGDFSFPTNAFFWLVQAWYAPLYLFGKLTHRWTGFDGFKELLAGDAPLFYWWGRLLGIVCASAAIVVFSRVLRATVSDRRVRALGVALLIANPIDLVSAAWLKFDGAALLATAILTLSWTRYQQGGDERARRHAWLAAVVACSVRVDLLAFVLLLALHDLYERRRLRPIVPALVWGAIAYGALTLVPVVLLVHLSGRAPATHAVLPTALTFEQAIARNMEQHAGGALRLAGIVTRNVRFYGALFLALAPVSLLALWPGQEARRRWLLLLAALFLFPLVVFTANGTRYFLPPSALLIVAGAWRCAEPDFSRWRLPLLVASLLLLGTIDAAIVRRLRAGDDARVLAGRFLVEHSGAGDWIAIDSYQNPGQHAEVPECADELVAKADAVKALGRGTGETFRAAARRQEDACRHIVEISDVDQFAGTDVAGRFVAPLDAVLARRPRPRMVTSNRPLPAHPSLRLAAAFVPRFADPRVRWILRGTFYVLPIYVYAVE